MSGLGEELERIEGRSSPRGAVLIYFRSDGMPVEHLYRHAATMINRTVARDLVAQYWPADASVVRALAVVSYPDRKDGAPVEFRFDARPL